MPLKEGQTFAAYKIIRLLGSGAMGEVYLAEHPRLPRRNALKVLPADISGDPDYRARFNREADLASALWHQHIVSVHDRGEHEGQLWISMDYVHGLDAARLLAQQYPAGMPVELVQRIVAAVAGALDYAHKQGLLHRDVKPANIMVTAADDDEQRVLLGDFGIARRADDISGLTATNMTVGTVAYSAPEQLLGEDLDGRADQYALAATTYHLLTGSPLFPNSNPAVVISRHLNSPAPLLADTYPQLAPLDPVLAVALSKDPSARFRRCSDFAATLAAKASSPGSARTEAEETQAAASTQDPSPAAQPEPKRPAPKRQREGALRRRRAWLMPVGVTAAILVATTAILLAQVRKEDRSTTGSTASGTSTAPGAATAATPQPSSPSSSLLDAGLPNVPPIDAGCHGDVLAHADIQHPTLGTIRLFLLHDNTPYTYNADCVQPVTRAGQALLPIQVNSMQRLHFATPAQDATRNTFVFYTTARYDAVLVLIPGAEGFQSIGWESNSYGGNTDGKHAYVDAKLIGPDSSGRYTIRQSHDDCTPDCANGTITSKDLRWNGTDYLP